MDDRPPSLLWANDLFMDRLWVFELFQGALTRVEDLALPGTIDNVEFDAESGDLTMGLCCGSGASLPGLASVSSSLPQQVWLIESSAFLAGNGAIVAPRAEDPEIYFEQDTGREYAVSCSVRYRQWLLLGSPGDTGLVVCDLDVAGARGQV